MKKISLLFIALTLPGVSTAMEENSNDLTTYKGKEIDATSIYELSPKLSSEQKEAVDNFIFKNKDLLLKLIAKTNEFPVSTTELKKLKEENNTLFTQSGLKNESENNYAIPLDNNLYIKFAGLINRFITLIHSNTNPITKQDYGWGSWNQITPEQIEALTKHDTFQTVSQLAHYLKAHDLLEKDKDITGIFIPKTYIANLPERSDITQKATDENTIIIQQAVPSQFKVAQNNLKLLEKIDNKTLAGLYKLVKEATLWNIAGNLLVDESTGNVSTSDFEQPNNERAKNFFQKDSWKANHNKVAAIEGLAHLFYQAEKAGYNVDNQKAVLADLIVKDTDLQIEKGESDESRIAQHKFTQGQINQLKNAARYDFDKK